MDTASMGAAATAAPMGVAADLQLASRLVQIPAELLERVTSHLTTTDLARMRLTCKAVEKRLFRSFAREFFCKRQFMVSDSSLQALADIARHPALGPKLHHVIIGTDVIPPDEPASLPRRPLSFECHRELQLYAVSRDHLLAGDLRERLAGIFRLLPNLQTVEIRDFDSPTRKRDGTRWRSYGARTLSGLAGTSTICGMPEPLRGPGNIMPLLPDSKHASAVFAAVVRALAISGARPRSIEMCLRSYPVRESAYFIPPHVQTETRALLAALRTLHMVVSSRPTPYDVYPIPFAQDTSVNAKKFLALANQVTWLRLNMSPPTERRTAVMEHRPFLMWLGRTKPALLQPNEAFFDQDAPPVLFPFLTRFDLGKTTLRLSFLSSILLKLAPTLRHLCLRSVSIAYNREQNHGGQTWDPWTVFFERAFDSPEKNARAEAEARARAEAEAGAGDAVADPLDFDTMSCCNLRLTALQLRGLGCTTPGLGRVLFRLGPEGGLASEMSFFNITNYDRFVDDLVKALVIKWKSEPEGN